MGYLYIGGGVERLDGIFLFFFQFELLCGVGSAEPRYLKCLLLGNS